MHIRQFTDAEIREALAIPDINQRKAFLQTIIIDHFAKTGNLIVEAFTGFGKGYLCKELLRRYRIKFNDYVNVVSPKISIHEMWAEELKSQQYIRNFVINSYTRSTSEEERSCGILILDEGHWAAGKESMFFSTAIPITRTKRTLLLSATLRKDQHEYLESVGIHHVFRIPLATGIRLGILPAYYQFNVPVQLTREEKKEYLAVQNDYYKALTTFTLYDAENAVFYANACLARKDATTLVNNKHLTAKEIATQIGEVLERTAGSIIGDAIKWQQATTKRKLILQRAVEKGNAVQQILDAFKDKRVLVFAPLIDTAEKIAKQYSPSGEAYHSKLGTKKSKKVLDYFDAGLFNHLISCGKLKEGVNISNISYGVNVAINSQAKDLIQMMGRILRYESKNPEKVAVMMNLYVEDFNVATHDILSQEKKWLRSAQYQQPFVQWLDSIDELWDELEQLNIIKREIEVAI